MTNIEFEKHLETIAFSEAESKMKHRNSQTVSKGREYATPYGEDAITRIIPVVKSHIETLYTSFSFYDKPFLSEILKPYTDIKVKGIRGTNLDRVCEMVALNIASNLSTTPTLSNTVGRLTTSFSLLANLDFDVAKVYQEDIMQFFLGVVMDIEKLDIYAVEGEEGGKKLILSPQWVEHANKLFNNTPCANYAYKPMIIEPLDHHDLTSNKGGYLLCKSPLLKYPGRVNGRVLDSIKNFNSSTNPGFFDRLNAAQKTPYCVNTLLLEVLTKYYNEGKFFKDFPSNINQISDRVKEEIAHEVNTRNEKRQSWATLKGEEFTPLRSSTVKEVESKFTAKAVEDVRKTNELMYQANYFSSFPAFYFPLFLDFRGRRYTYSQTGLTYQGTEMAKALICHAQKEAFTQGGLQSLLITLGTALDFGKETISTRFQVGQDWWKTHRASFMAGDFSIFFDQQDSFDEPINALAIVLELVEYTKDKEYKSGYIAHRDARCSGASIIGTLLRDGKIMAQTSVIDDCIDQFGKLPDAYMNTANVGLGIAEEMAKGDALAQDLLGYKEHLFTRSVFKTPVMTKSAYGLTDYSLREKNKELFRSEDVEVLTKQHKNLFDTIMLKALDGSLPSCSKFLKIAQKMGEQIGKRDGIISFSSPINGFPFVMREMKIAKRRITSPVGFQRVVLVMKTRTGKVDPLAMKNGLAPNLIHHVDSTLLDTVQGVVEYPITCIHDSIGSHPNNCNTTVGHYAKAMFDLSSSNFLDGVFEQVGFDSKVPYANTVENLEAVLNSQHILS